MDEGLAFLWQFLLPVLPYFILLLLIWIYLLKVNRFKPGDLVPSTFVSVVIACRNEEKNISALLSKISGQDYPKNLFEIIVVDDNSTDATKKIVSSRESIRGLKLIPNQGKGKKAALRTGIRAAKGELILTTDADCDMGENWIMVITSFFEKEKPDMIIPPVRLQNMPGFFGNFQELEFLSLQAITAGTARAGWGTMCNGANLAFTKKAYLENEKNLRFDIATGDDVFLLHSLKKQKGSILWLESPESLVVTKPATDIRSFLVQRRRWASKASAYKDAFSVLLGFVTFVTILYQLILLLISFSDNHFLIIFSLFFLLKSIPDFLLLLNVTRRYGRPSLMKWFIPCQLAYPFYFIAVAGFAVFGTRK